MAKKGKSVLGNLLAEKQKQEGISTRELGRRIGIAHTTVARILDGQDTTLDTVEKVAEYLQVNPADLINVKSKVEAEALSAKITPLWEAEPRLAKVFQEAIYRLDQDEISPEAMRDIIRYAAYRLDMEAEDKELADKYETTSP